MYQIQNEFLKIGVLSKGAELCSIKNLKTNTEHIWQADPNIWSSHAPNLFPIVGSLKDGNYTYEGKVFSLARHGFIRNNENLVLKEKSDDKLVFGLLFSEETLKIYPFEFKVEITFALQNKTLKVSHKVINLDRKVMYFSLGGHPAFNAPLYEGESYEDYHLEFDQKIDLDTYLLNEEGLISEKTAVVTRDNDKIKLHQNLFDNDALIFKNIKSKKLALKSKEKGTVLSVEYKDFKHLGIWAKPAARYVCIEPWLGYADVAGTTKDLKTKEGIMEIMPSETFDASYTIIIA